MPNPFKDLTTLPVIGAPMFIISTPQLVVAQCKAGIVGCFPSVNARPQAELKVWIQTIKAELAKAKAQDPSAKIAPFGVNIVALSSNKRMQQDIEVCIEEEVPLIITSMQPPTDLSKRVQAYGGLHFHDVTTLRHARKAIAAGVDGVVLVAAGAGGHAGTINPFPFVQEVRNEFDGTICLAGGISTGQDILASKILGADLAYMGTRFIASKEANAEEGYKQMIIESGTSDVVYTPQFTGVSATFLTKSVEAAGFTIKNLQGPGFKKPNKLWLWWKHFRMSRVKKWKELWSAGQGVATIDSVESVATIVSELKSEYSNCIKQISNEF